MLEFFKIVFYQPLYNGLVFLMDIIPGADAGIAVILLTVIVKLVLFPLSKRSIETQFSMRRFQPELDELKKKYA
ncbi:MAG: putative 60 kDa inner membrane insertion protein, partial [Parcubacteria group bacterium Gr01-1014_70]